MRRSWLLWGALGACVAVSTAHAQSPLVPAPAATLLFPYVETDLASATGADTLLSVHNSSMAAALTNVVVWSAAGVPVLRFNLYLTGYDAEVISFRALLEGQLPGSASAGQDPQDTRSPQGSLSQDINFASCNGVLPLAALSASEVARVKAALTGAPLPGMNNRCAAPASGMMARAYVTVDVVNSCEDARPGDAGYFVQGGTGVAANQNLLLGEFILAQEGAERAVGSHAVHLQAATVPAGIRTSTFYGARVGYTGADGRMALPGTWTAPYEGARAELLVWRDPKVAVTDYACDALPAYGALSLEALWVFDRSETAVDMTRQALFPNVVNRVAVGDDRLPVLARAGWFSMGLHHASTANPVQPAPDPTQAQAYVLVLTQRERLGTRRPFHALRPGTPGDSPIQPRHVGDYP